MSRYRFALRPKWILSHLFVAFMVVLMVNLGFWQLRRLHDRKAHNRTIEQRRELAAAPLPTVLRAGATKAQIDAAEFRVVTARGTYRSDQEVLVRGRSQDSAPGSWVLTPLVQADGTAIIVNRGWIPNSGTLNAVPADMRAHPGTFTVTGLLQKTETKGLFESSDPATGRLTNMARVDVARIQKQVPERLVPGWIQLATQRPPAPKLPRPLDPPTLDEGPHFSYAIQWFLFSTGTVVFYPLILRRRAGEIEKEEAEAAATGSPPPR